MATFVILAVGLGTVYALRPYVGRALFDGREPGIYFAAVALIVIVAACAGHWFVALMLSGLSVYTYVRISHQVHGIRFNGILPAVRSFVELDAPARRLLK